MEVREMNLGRGDRFHYGICASCGSLNLLDPPARLEPYYPPSEYYALRSQWPVGVFDRVVRSRASFGRAPRMLRLLAGWELSDTALFAVGRLGIPPTAAILDVGSGRGHLVENLARLGYPHAIGVDPFLAAGPRSVRVRLGGFEVVLPQERFDLVMFHHSLEHTPDPAAMLAQARSHMTPGGILLLRLPLVGPAFERFGAAWYGIDAPRHFFVPTPSGVRALLARSGFEEQATYFDSTSAQFLVSREFEQGGSARRRHSVGRLGGWWELLRGEARAARREAAAANLLGTGDQIVVQARLARSA